MTAQGNTPKSFAEERLEEIKSRLSAITQGSWKKRGSQITDTSGEAIAVIYTICRSDIGQLQSWGGSGPYPSKEEQIESDANSELIMNAPSDIKFLLELYEAARSEHAK